MQSSKQFEVHERYDGTPGWGVYPMGEWSNWIAHLMNKEQAERLCAMLNDTKFDALQVGGYEYQTDADNKRTAQISKLFCMQENLTWTDLGLKEHHVQRINEFLELPLDLRQREGA